MNRKMNRSNRILSFLLAVVLFLGALPLPAFSTEGGEASVDAPYITLKGEQIDFMELHPHEKIEIRAEGVVDAAQYQWQILHPEKEDLWVNIYDATEQSISVTLALVGNMLNAENVAQLRCRMLVNGMQRDSAPVTVKLLEEENGVVDVPAVDRAAGAGETEDAESGIQPLAEGEDDPADPTEGTQPPDFVEVRINYVRYDYVLNNDTKQLELVQIPGEAFGSYIATLHYGSPLQDTTVTFPIMVGYDTYLVREDKTQEQCESITFNLASVTEDITYTVEYRPAEVDYLIRYYMQNVYDDLYVEDTDAAEHLSGQTGQVPDSNYIKKEFDGFESLFYQPDYIAADGSTVFEVYYERKYYLMEFDCDGGYGADTVYVRYGTHISIPNPVKAGWVFGGWDLVRSDNPKGQVTKGDGVTDSLPNNMPPYNTAYKAIWNAANTTYHVSYWIVNDDGTRTYLGGHIEDGVSGQKVSGKDDLGETDGNGNPVANRGEVCGYRAHTHNESCYACSGDGHTHHFAHVQGCYSFITSYDSSAVTNQNDLDAMVAANKGSSPQEGDIYFISTTTNSALWPKIYLNGAYHTISVNGSSTVPRDKLAEITEGGLVGKAQTAQNYIAERYRAKPTCDKDICKSSCGFEAHTHNSNCYQDTRHLQYVDSIEITKEDNSKVKYATDKEVLIEGDGSTTVNVYYQYKEYTLKFYYAASTGSGENIKYHVVGGSTYFFGGQHQTEHTYAQHNNSTTMEMLDRMFAQTNHVGQTADGAVPTLNQRGQDRVTSKVYTQGSDVDYKSQRTYYYISFKARYGDDISQKWPCDILEPVTMKSGNTNNSWTEDYASASAWNGEHHVWYSKHEGNETIKGIYEKLDSKLLYDTSFDDSLTVSYLCFWENGASGVSWNIPELYRYHIYLQTYDGQNTEGLETVIRNGKTYYLADSYNTCDNSSVSDQKHPVIAGYTFKDADRTWSTYFFANATKNATGAYYIDGERKYENGYIYSGSWSYAGTLKEHDMGNGNYILYDPAKYDPTNPDTVINHNVYREAYDVNFFYDAVSYKLSFWNYDGYLTDGTGAMVPYAEPLRKRFEGVTVDGVKLHEGANDLVAKPEKYPETLEPGSYSFKGWYTTAECYDGTEVNWKTMAMPDGDLMVYAKWEPVVHDVYFYYLYDHIKKDEYWVEPKDEDGNPKLDTEGNPITISYPIKAPHGTILGTTYSYTPERKGYDFVGWFYMDQDNKKRFAPDTMEVTQELHLFAEWQSGIDTTYEVTYKLEDGTEIADKTAGHITAGKTKTFLAKGMTDLYADYRTCYFPDVNSHSILMDANGNYNKHTFTYKQDEEVLYQVRYVDAVTGVVLDTSEVIKSKHAIVTEKFKPFVGYIPQSYYIRKTLSHDGAATEPKDENIITFYYTPDKQHGLYSIEYYLENADSTDSAKPENYTQYEYTVGSGNTGVRLTAKIRTYDGYTHIPSMNTVITYDDDGKETTLTGVGKDHDPPAPYGDIAYTGLTIKIYYRRNTYPYKVSYVNAENEAALTPADSSLAEKLKEQQGKFDMEFSHTAPASFKATDGNTYDYYIPKPTSDQLTQKKTVRAATDVADNTMTFYYVQRQVTVEYKAVCKEELPTGTKFGATSPNKEVGTKAGATALPYEGFRFVGWYKDEACTTSVDTEWVNGAKLTPQVLYETGDWTNRYYALFEPVKENLMITKAAASETNLGNDTFLFRVTGRDIMGNHVDLTVSIQGARSVTIKDLYCGTYTVTELTDWSWAYRCTDDATKTVQLTINDRDGEGNLLDSQITTYEVTFTNAAQSVDWLHGESEAKENQFK